MNRAPAATPDLDALPAVPRGADGPVFREPWEAHAFALAVKLHEAGLFTWPEWAAALAVEIKAAGAGDDGSAYYRHWLAALEALIVAKGAATPAALDAMTERWHEAAARTPHGRPITLS